MAACKTDNSNNPNDISAFQVFVQQFMRGSSGAAQAAPPVQAPEPEHDTGAPPLARLAAHKPLRLDFGGIVYKWYEAEQRLTSTTAVGYKHSAYICAEARVQFQGFGAEDTKRPRLAEALTTLFAASARNSQIAFFPQVVEPQSDVLVSFASETIRLLPHRAANAKQQHRLGLATASLKSELQRIDVERQALAREVERLKVERLKVERLTAKKSCDLSDV